MDDTSNFAEVKQDWFWSMHGLAGNSIQVNLCFQPVKILNTIF